MFVQYNLLVDLTLLNLAVTELVTRAVRSAGAATGSTDLVEMHLAAEPPRHPLHGFS